MHDAHYMGLATEVAARSTCPQRRAGAVLVKHDGATYQHSTGYDGAPRGMPHCDLHGCDLDLHEECENAVHAIANAILRASFNLEDSILYTTHHPCRRCMGLVINAGVKRIVSGDTSNAEWVATAAANALIAFQHYESESPI